jgi:hypothetical protein
MAVERGRKKVRRERKGSDVIEIDVKRIMSSFERGCEGALRNFNFHPFSAREKLKHFNKFAFITETSVRGP